VRHGVAGTKFSRPTSQRLALFRNLVTEVIRHERITTTEAKAKAIRPLVEQVITLGKRGDLHSRRQAYSRVYDPKLVDKVFFVLAERYADRPGGYTRIIKLGPRLGDAAPMALIEFVK
jgi:large subunit ribosomal protein L17